MMMKAQLFGTLLALLAMPVLAVIAVEYDAPIVTDPDAKGKYHWYPNRRMRHTDIRQSKNAGRNVLPNAVTGDAS